MNPVALLALISEMYAQIAELKAEVERLRQPAAREET